ncbi:MAG TPA: ribokinase [Kofleriaceae bacterium]|nr:ribokinase [Kofleriaceae bacterium]
MADRLIAVVGSLNADLVIPVRACPRPGETVLGGTPARHLGGKGANQAVAAARAGGRVAMVGRVGSDDAGDALVAGLAGDGVDVAAVTRDAGPSGFATIFVAADGENAIVVVPGANATLAPAHVADLPAHTALVVLQLETPLATVAAAIERAAQCHIPVLLNAAPATADLPAAVLRAVDCLVVNEHEAATLAGTELATIGDAPEAWIAIAGDLCHRGCRRVVITRGARGLVWATTADHDRPDHAATGHLAAFAVDAIDTTAAGDAFCGALAAQLVAGIPWATALRFASAAGALATTRRGAQSSLPTAGELDRFIDARKTTML